MWDQRPPLRKAEFARQLGIAHTTLNNWLRGARPEMALLFVVQDRTGIPLKRLMEAAGYPTPPDPDAAFEYILDDLRRDPELVESEREFLIRRISDLRERYSREQKSPEPSEPEGSEGSHPASDAGSGSSALQSCAV